MDVRANFLQLHALPWDAGVQNFGMRKEEDVQMWRQRRSLRLADAKKQEKAAAKENKNAETSTRATVESEQCEEVEMEDNISDQEDKVNLVAPKRMTGRARARLVLADFNGQYKLPKPRGTAAKPGDREVPGAKKQGRGRAGGKKQAK
ncbi:hypothetical protein WJX77_007978 [Trebouxia sp. C0004]